MGWDDSDDDDWEAADLSLPGAGAKNEAPDTWSDEEGHESHLQEDAAAEAAKTANAPKPKKEKTGLELKIEAREKREAEEAARKAELRAELGQNFRAEGEDGVDVSGMDEETLARKKMQDAADLDNAIDAFGLSADDKPKAAPKGKSALASKIEEREKKEAAAAASAAALAADPKAGRGEMTGSIDSLQPKTEEDFIKLGRLMHTKLRPFEGTKGHLATLKGLLRATADGMSTDDCKELATFVSTISNERLKADREKNKPKPKGGGKLKGKITAGKAADMDFGDDDDPFS